MKILFAVHSYYPEKDGVTIVTRYLSEGLANRGHYIAVVTEDKGKYKAFDTFKDVEIHRLDIRKQGMKYNGDRKGYFEFIDSFKPDILVIVCTQTWAFDWVKKVITKFKCKKVLFSHGYSGLKYSGVLDKYPVWKDIRYWQITSLKNHFYWKWYYLSAQKFMKKIDSIIYISNKGSDYKYGIKYNLTNYRILENAVEDQCFKEKMRSKNIKKTVFLNVANYNQNKNQLRILKAFYMTSLNNAKLIFCGSSPNQYMEKLIQEKKKLDSMGFRDVDILYGLSRNEVYQLYDNSDIFVLGSDWESFSLVLCEAGAKGLAAISTDVGCARNLDGCLVVKDEIEMAEAMKRLCVDKDLCIENGKKMKRFVMEHFRTEDKVLQLEKIFEEI